jgi:hypothetical protein
MPHAEISAWCETLARAAIEAMREPTKEMTTGDLAPWNFWGIEDAWPAMIDAALAEKPT